MNVKELKDFLATLPEEADGWDVNFCACQSEDDCMFISVDACSSHFDDESIGEIRESDPEATKNFVLLSSGGERE